MYYDPVDGRSLMLAELTDAGGWLVSSSEIVFSNCFDGVRASIRYRNSLDGIESDLILHERPAVTPQDIGFSDRTRLELFTEWVGDTPLPQKETRLLLREKDAEARRQMVEPDFTDATLTFGSLRMARGKAFTMGGTNAPPDSAAAPNAVTVGKRFEIIDGRKILIEAVEHRSVSSLLEKLPVAPLSGVLTNAAAQPLSPRGKGLAAFRNAVQQTTDQSIRLLPIKHLAQTKNDHRIQTAVAHSKRETRNTELAAAEPSAFILDWQTLSTSGLTDFTFSSATNYLCAATINFYGTTRIQGGTVVKFAPAPAAALLKFFGPIICDTDMHHPAYFVSKFDATVGEVMDGNTTPASYTGALELTTTGNKLKHLRVRNASVAVTGWDIDVRHSQFTACNTVFYMPESGAGSGPCRLGNVLVNNSGYIFSGTYYNVIATHLTVNNCYGALTSDPYDRSSAHFINSLLVNIDSMGAVETPMLTSSQVLPATPAVFQTVGGGALYLAAGSLHRGAGITTIDLVLFQELKQTTTWPPEILTGTLTANQVLPPNPLVPRNANPNPDRGYAYPAMDYLVRNLIIQGSAGTPVTLLVTNGAVLGFDPITSGSFGNGLSFGAYSDLISVGTPAALNRFVLSHAIQESCPTVPNYFTVLHGAGLGNYPNAFLRFSDLSLSAGNCRHLAYWSGGFIKLAFQDSQIRGGSSLGMYLGSDSPIHSVALTNNLLDQVQFTYHPYAVGSFHAWNNLFKGGLLTFDMNPVGMPALIFCDNLFDRAGISQTGGPTVDGNFNAYVQVLPTTPRLQPQGANDRPLLASSPAYETGPFGSNYLPSTATQLINQGSRTAANAGLYHYTTSKTAGSKEGIDPDPKVDIGLHYVAASAQNLPQDQDGDGRADYFEDRNGNGLYDSTLGETDWQAMMYVVRNFAGITEQDSGTIPPDTMGAVGPNHFVAILNGNRSVAVYDKNTGAKVSFPNTTMSQFFAVTVSSGTYANSYPTGGGLVDPRVIYDHQHQRWIASAIDAGSLYIILAVSHGPNPVGSGSATWVADNWTKYVIPLGPCTDYDTLGVDSNGIYLSATICGAVKVIALPKGPLLDGSAQTVQEHFIKTIPGLFAAIQPGVNFEPITINDPAWFVYETFGTINYNRLKWVNGPNGEPVWEMAPWGQLTISESYNSPSSAPQFGSTILLRLSHVGSRLMMATVGRVGGVQHLWTCHQIEVNSMGNNQTIQADRSAVAWYKIQLDSPVSIVNSGRMYDSTPAPNQKFYYMPSLAVNNHGDMVIGFSGSSANDYVGAYYTGKLNNGAMPNPPIRYFSGTDWFYSPAPDIKWGDYSYTSAVSHKRLY